MPRDYTINFNYNGSTTKKTSMRGNQISNKRTQIASYEKERVQRVKKNTKYLKRFAFASSVKMLSTYISTGGLRTGNYARQRRQELLLQGAGRGASIIGGFLLNPLYGAGILIGNAIDLGSRAYRRNLEVTRDNNVADLGKYYQGMEYNSSRFGGKQQ